MNAFKLLRAGQGQTEGASRGGGGQTQLLSGAKLGFRLYFTSIIWSMSYNFFPLKCFIFGEGAL